MINGLPPPDELTLAEVVTTCVGQIPHVAVPIGPEVSFSTVGPGSRIRGVAVNRKQGALNIEIELVITMKTDRSIPGLSSQVRGRVREAITCLTEEPIRWINIRIADVLFQG